MYSGSVGKLEFFLPKLPLCFPDGFLPFPGSFQDRFFADFLSEVVPGRPLVRCHFFLRAVISGVHQDFEEPPPPLSHDQDLVLVRWEPLAKVRSMQPGRYLVCGKYVNVRGIYKREK